MTESPDSEIATGLPSPERLPADPIARLQDLGLGPHSITAKFEDVSGVTANDSPAPLAPMTAMLPLKPTEVPKRARAAAFDAFSLAVWIHVPLLRSSKTYADPLRPDWKFSTAPTTMEFPLSATDNPKLSPGSPSLAVMRAVWAYQLRALARSDKESMEAHIEEQRKSHACGLDCGFGRFGRRRGPQGPAQDPKLRISRVNSLLQGDHTLFFSFSNQL